MSPFEKLLRRELYKRSFYDFVKDFWNTCETNKMIDGKIIKIDMPILTDVDLKNIYDKLGL